MRIRLPASARIQVSSVANLAFVSRPVAALRFRENAVRERVGGQDLHVGGVFRQGFYLPVNGHCGTSGWKQPRRSAMAGPQGGKAPKREENP